MSTRAETFEGICIGLGSEQNSLTAEVRSSQDRWFRLHTAHAGEPRPCLGGGQVRSGQERCFRLCRFDYDYYDYDYNYHGYDYYAYDYYEYHDYDYYDSIVPDSTFPCQYKQFPLFLIDFAMPVQAVSSKSYNYDDYYNYSITPLTGVETTVKPSSLPVKH